MTKRIDLGFTNKQLNALTTEEIIEKVITPAIDRHVNVRFDLFVLPTESDYECYQISTAEETAFVAKLQAAVAKFPKQIRLNESVGGMCGYDHRYTIIMRTKK